jgi:putative molybdopterin biosynthesis protein
MKQEQPEPPAPNGSTDLGWLTSREAADLIHVNPRTIQKLVKRKQLPASRIGRALRIRKSDIDAYMENHRAT